MYHFYPHPIPVQRHLQQPTGYRAVVAGLLLPLLPSSAIKSDKGKTKEICTKDEGKKAFSGWAQPVLLIPLFLAFRLLRPQRYLLYTLPLLLWPELSSSRLRFP